MVLPGEAVAAQLVADIADRVLAVDVQLARIDAQIGETFRRHPQAAVIESMPGIGPILGAEFVVAAGDMSAYSDAGHLASAAGLVPVPRDSGRRTGNMHRPKRYSRRTAAGLLPLRSKPRSSKMDRIASSTSRNEVKE